MKRLTCLCAIMSLTCLPATAARAQAGSAMGPTFGASWVLPTTSDATHHFPALESEDLSGRVHLGIAVPGGEVYAVAARLTALGPEHAFVQATSTEAWRDTDHRIRLTAGAVGIRPYVLDGTVRLAPYLEMGAGWFESVSTTETMPEAVGPLPVIRPVHDTERHQGWARTMAGGVTAELRLGGGFGLGLHAGLTDVRPSARALHAEVGEPRLYYAGAMIAWSPEPRRRHRAGHIGFSNRRDRAVEPVRSLERVERVPGRVVIGKAAGPAARAVARLTISADDVPEIRLTGDSLAVAALAARLESTGNRLRLDPPDQPSPADAAANPTPAGPQAITLDVRIPDAGSAERLALLPGVDRVGALTVRLERLSPDEAARFIEFVVSYRR